jgi:hypothetical protein
MIRNWAVQFIYSEKNIEIIVCVHQKEQKYNHNHKDALNKYGYYIKIAPIKAFCFK